MAADHFCLRWNNYQNNMVTELDSLRSEEDLVDVTLSCEGHLLKAHKVILSACSSYFRNVFKDNPCKHPVVILKDVSYEDVEALLSFVYQGVVFISEKKLASFLQTAELLQIRGLTGAATTMKDGSFSDSTATQNKIAEKGNVPPPPQLLTANVINSWKRQGINTTTSSMKSPLNSPPSPSISASKRRKCTPNKVKPVKESSECSDTNSNQGCSETESDLMIIKHENVECENRDPEDDCNSIGEISREESSREGNPSFYDNMESDETEEESGEIRNKTVVSNSDKSGNSNASCSSLFGIMPNFTSQSSAEQNSSVPGDTRLGRRPCPLCQKIISNKSNLLKHMRIRHSDEHNPAGCTICNKVFKNKYSLRAHINIYHKEMNTGTSSLSLSASYSSYLSSSEYSTHSHQHQQSQSQPPPVPPPPPPQLEPPTSQQQEQSTNVDLHTDYISSQSAVSLSYSPTNSNSYNVVPSSINNDMTPYELIKESIISQFDLSNLPLT